MATLLWGNDDEPEDFGVPFYILSRFKGTSRQETWVFHHGNLGDERDFPLQSPNSWIHTIAGPK